MDYSPLTQPLEDQMRTIAGVCSFILMLWSSASAQQAPAGGAAPAGPRAPANENIATLLSADLLLPEVVPHHNTDAASTLKTCVFETTPPQTALKAYGGLPLAQR